MAEDKLHEVLEQVTDKFIADEMLKHIEKAWPVVVDDKALREQCADFIGNAPEDKKVNRASSLVKLAAVATPKQQDDGGFQKFLDENFAGMPLDEETINGLRQSYNDMFKPATEAIPVEDYKYAYLYKDLSVALKDTLPNLERMAEQYNRAMAMAPQHREDLEKIPAWSIINDKVGYKYAAMNWLNEYAPHAANEDEAKEKVDFITRTASAKGQTAGASGLHDCLEAMLQKSAMMGTAMEILGELHPQFDKADKAVYREQIKEYPSVALAGLLMAQLRGKEISSPQQLNEVINDSQSVSLGIKLDELANTGGLPYDKLVDRKASANEVSADNRLDVTNKETVRNFVKKDMALQNAQQRAVEHQYA